MYIERKIEDYLSYVAKHFPVTVITGARQTGKTTLRITRRSRKTPITLRLIILP